MRKVNVPNYYLPLVLMLLLHLDRIYIGVDRVGQHDTLDIAIVLQEYMEHHNTLKITNVFVEESP
jgi:hypothetical protein